MSKVIILHMGLHKTATTSIQNTLTANRKRLLSNKYFYPDFRTHNCSYNNHSTPMFGLFTQHPERYRSYIRSNLKAHEINKYFMAHLEKYLQASRSLILSGEDISSLQAPGLQSLKHNLEKAKAPIRPIVFIRDPLSHFISATQQNLKIGITTIKNMQANPYTKISKIKNIKNVFPQTEFYPFDYACDFKDGPVAFFLYLLDLNPNKFTLIRNNDSISMSAAYLLDYLNQRCTMFLDNKINFTRINHDIYFIREIVGPKFNLLKQAISPIYNKLKNLRTQVEELANIKFQTPMLTLDEFPERFTWEEVSINSFIDLIPRLNAGVLYRSYDYFYELHKQKVLTKSNLDRIGQAIEAYLEIAPRVTPKDIELIKEASLALSSKSKTAKKMQLLVKELGGIF